MPYNDSIASNLNNGFAVAINIIAKEGKGDAVAAILQGLIEPTMAEEGVKFFVPYRSPTDPLSFFVYELYVDEAGWEAHNNAPHFLNVVDELVSLAAHRQRIPFVPFA
ncbi:putative quinol monooxygenase [Thalassospira australica]|uniref:putative quinol monooxygenase n=1 Tax=Thalassospira australica TaxID=1528106 RepID=UPI00384ACE84